jgi:acetolactate synthase-1/2/3 large subunit
MDYAHNAIERADQIISIGHDTVENPPFLVGSGGPKVRMLAICPPRSRKCSSRMLS